MQEIPPGIEPRDWIARLEKGLAIIEAFNDANTRLTPTQAAQITGLTRTAARRYLLTLTAIGYAATDGKVFWLTPRVLRLGSSYLESGRIPRIVQPFLQRITASTQESAFVAVRDGDTVVYVARNGANRPRNTGFVLGARAPLAIASSGIILLADDSDAEVEAWLARYEPKPFTPYTILSKDRLRVEIARARANGYCVLEQQMDLAVRGIAVALRDRDGVAVGGLSVSIPMGTASAEDEVRRVLPALQETAATLRNLL